MILENGKMKLRYAVVGIGHLAQVAVLPAFASAPNSELVAIISDDAAKRKKIGKKYELEHVYSYDDYDRALSVVDALYLVLPNHLHRDYAVRAANAGVPRERLHDRISHRLMRECAAGTTLSRNTHLTRRGSIFGTRAIMPTFRHNSASTIDIRKL